MNKNEQFLEFTIKNSYAFTVVKILENYSTKAT